MIIKDESGDWELSDDDGLVISADCGQIGWELSNKEERQLAEHLCAKHKLNDFWFDMYQEERDRNSELFTNYFSLTKKHQELVEILVNIPPPKGVSDDF